VGVVPHSLDRTGQVVQPSSTQEQPQQQQQQQGKNKKGSYKGHLPWLCARGGGLQTQV